MIEKITNQNQIARHKLAEKNNELVDVVNAIQKERESERFEIQEWIGILEAVRKSVNIHEKQIDELQMKAEPEKCETRAENVQPDTESRSENVQDELDRTRKALDVAVDALKDCNKILSADMKDWEYLTADIALKQIEQITALEQKD